MSESSQQPLEDMLLKAQVLADTYTDHDTDAALERIARRSLWHKAAALENRARRARHHAYYHAASDARPRCLHSPPQSEHAQAAQRLEMLSTRIVRDHRAIRTMAHLVDDAQVIDPAGALAFACLLYLADCQSAAQFWWQFAAGGGIAAAASCLTLHHLQHAEVRTAMYWQGQAEFLQSRYGPRREDQDTVYIADGKDHDHYYLAGTPEACVASLLHSGLDGDHEGRWWVFTSHLADAVRRLHTCADEEYGTIPQPDPDLAAELAAQVR